MKQESFSQRHSRALVTRVLVTAALVLALPAMAEASREERAQLRDQGIHYFRQGLYEQALPLLQQAHERSGGGRDFRVLFFLARTYYEVLQIDKALELAQEAIEHAPDHRERMEAEEFLHGLEDFFGRVELVPSDPDYGDGERGFLLIEDVDGLINVQKRSAYDQIRLMYIRNPIQLPTIVYLPTGTTYDINGVSFELMEEGDSALVAVPLARSLVGLVDDDLLAPEPREEASFLSRVDWVNVGLGGGAVVTGVVAVVMNSMSRGYVDDALSMYNEHYLRASSDEDLAKARQAWQDNLQKAANTRDAAWISGGLSVALVTSGVVWNLLLKPALASGDAGTSRDSMVLSPLPGGGFAAGLSRSW